jgi:hypothetical protein
MRNDPYAVAAKTAPLARPQRASTISGEFWGQQVPLFGALMATGFLAAYLQYGFIPGAKAAFPLADVRVPVWHLVWMGLWTGYTMALVGQAAGIFALPYSTSVLQFTNSHVTPTLLVLTFLNPIGALLGFRRSGQWNLNLAAAVCLGGAVGGIIGPFLRATVLANADTFRFVLGLMLAGFGLQLCYKAWRDYSRFGRVLGRDFIAQPKSIAEQGTVTKFKIETVSRSFSHIIIRFGAEERRLANSQLFLAGAGVGVISSALGVGGGFLLVPIFAMAYRLPIYVMVAATIPYTVALSSAGILTFSLILPLFGTVAIQPEWSWGFFAAAGGVFGAWWASKTQLYVPEHLLNWMLGGVTGIAGLLYVLNYLVRLHS